MEEPKIEWATKWLADEKSNFVQGEWVSAKGDNVFQAVNPANQQPLASFRCSVQEDVDLAVAAATGAFTSGHWREFSRAMRARSLCDIAELIRNHAAELATLETLANGKLYRESWYDDLPGCSDVFTYYAGWIDKIYGESSPVAEGYVNYTKHDPLGACGLIVPWNFPLLLACWKIAPALAAGNTVIVKPSEYTPFTLIRLFELIDEAKILPPGVLNLVLGDKECGQAITAHPDIAKVSFTGSTTVGKEVVQSSGASNLKRVTLELGGKSPVILFKDIQDIDAVVSHCATALFCHKGEKCSEPTRFLIERSIYDEVLAKLATRAEEIVCGDPFDKNSQQGPQCYRAHYDRVVEYIQSGIDEGARLVAGGVPDNSSDPDGLFIRPTVFADVKNHMKIAQEEIFGPVLCAIPFEGEDEAVQIANDTFYGLAAGVYSDSTSRAHRVADKLDAGMVFINRYGCYDLCSPFGGVKQSGWGREMGREGYLEYTRSRSIWVYHGE